MVSFPTTDSLATRTRRASLRVDPLLIGTTLLLSLIGLVMIYSATRDKLALAGGDPRYYLKRQLVFFVLGLGVLAFTTLFDYRRWEHVATAMYVSIVVMLLAVLSPLGSHALGAQRWFSLGPLQVQPSQFATLVMVIAIATYCSRRPDGLVLRDLVRIVLMTAVPTGLIILQPDLGTGIVLAAQHDPIVLAKQVATLDHLSGGRVELGIGYGWNREEAADHGLDFDRRREVAREHVLCMRALWQDDPAEFHGDHVDLPPCWSRPKPAQARLPVLVGGGAGPRTFAAIAEFGDGWLPIGASGLTEALPRLHAAVEAAGRDPSEVRVIPFGTIPTAAKLEHLAGLGIGEVVLRLASGPADGMLAELDGLAAFLPVAGALGG